MACGISGITFIHTSRWYPVSRRMSIPRNFAFKFLKRHLRALLGKENDKTNALGMRPMQERVYEKRGEQYLLIKSPPASGKSRALMFVAIDKLQNQGLKQAIIVVPEKAIGASFQDEPLSKFGFWADWRVEPKWNLCNAPGDDNGGKVKAVGTFLESND